MTPKIYHGLRTMALDWEPGSHWVQLQRYIYTYRDEENKELDQRARHSTAVAEHRVICMPLLRLSDEC